MILTDRQLAILNHVVEDGQSWADNALKEDHVLSKIAKYESAYDDAVAQGSYKNRQQRDEAEAQIKQDKIDNASWDVKRQKEYPTIEELVVALYDTDDKAAIEKRRSDVKAKYPKP
jgi:hypothetical protein